MHLSLRTSRLLWTCLGVSLMGLPLYSDWSLIHAAPVEGTAGHLLLEGNRVSTGKISREGTAYVVQLQSGKLVIPKEQVLFHGETMAQLYHHLQDQLPRKPQAEDHLSLARWCLAFRMLPEARQELEAALDLEPTREDIREWLHKVDVLLTAPPTTTPRVERKTPEQLQQEQGQEPESLAGLSRQAGQTFTRKIHPILMNNCTNSACHGPSRDHQREFQLSYVRAGAVNQKRLIEENLLAIMNYVDREQPRKSPLLTLIAQNHGAKGQSIFSGPRGEEQARIIREWVLSLNADALPAANRTVIPTVAVEWPQENRATSPAAKTTSHSRSALSSTSRSNRGETAPRESEAEVPREFTGSRSTSRKSAKSEGTTERRSISLEPAGDAPSDGLAEVPQEPLEPISPPSRRGPSPRTSTARALSPSTTTSKEPAKLPDAFDPGEFNRLQRSKKTLTGKR